MTHPEISQVGDLSIIDAERVITFSLKDLSKTVVVHKHTNLIERLKIGKYLVLCEIKDGEAIWEVI